MDAACAAGSGVLGMIGEGGEVLVVQFLHPGRECVPAAGVSVVGWNRGEHRRKFLRVAGRCVDASGVVRSGVLGIWAEWEAQSRVLERRSGPAGPLPRFVYQPLLARSEHAAGQNTDPFVFGPVFLFSNCRQFSHQLNPTRLQQLPPGSLLLFGSQLDGQFVLDTVRAPYLIGQPDQPPGGPVAAAFSVATLEPLAALPRFQGRTAQLYRGATYQDRGNGQMFSFVPARLDGARFPRPALPGSRFITPAMTMGFKITATSLDQVHALWQQITDHVRSHDLDLAFDLAEPELLPHDPTDPPTEPAKPAPATCAPARRQRC